jgi:tetratricopeptide (TPR) repeat protein
MTSHIYLALGRWDDVFDANVRANATLPRGLLSGHGTHWLHYSLVQLGRYHEADHWLDSMMRQAKTGPEGIKGDSWNAVGIMAAANIIDTHRYNAPAASMRVDQKYFNAGSYAEAIVDLSGSEFGYAVAALENGNRSVVDSILAELARMRSDAASDPGKATSIGYAGVAEMSLHGLVLEKDGRLDDALKTFRDAATLEASLPMPFGPPVMIKPPRELAGELLLKMKRPAEAKTEFAAALARTPRRTQVLLGLARSEKALGNAAESRKNYREVLAIWHKADADLPELPEVRAGAR